MRNRFCLLLTLAMLALLVFSPAASAESVNVLTNGSFEEPFVYGVGQGWGTFNNGGHASYGYHDDTWEKVIKDGEHSQLLELHTKAVGGSHRDRYMGIYQTVDVVPGKRYMLSFYGMVRSTEGPVYKSGYNYRVEIGFDYDGGTDPFAVEYTEMDQWPEYEGMLTPGSFSSYAHGVTTTSDKITVFIRLWKKFPTAHEQAIANIDAVSLYGPAAAVTTTASTADDSPETLPDTGANLLLPVIGMLLAVAVIALASVRIYQHKRSH